MNKVGILYICTGDYAVFWKDFFTSSEKFFLPNSEKIYFVFTDADSLYEESNERVHKIFQSSLGWPNNTLMRFHMFLTCKDELLKMDYLFFMNANCLCCDVVYEDDFLPMNSDLLVVKHPGFFNKSNREYTYERNKESKAYIPFGSGEVYVCGGVNGGRAASFLHMAEELRDWTDIDLSNNIVPIWHDESMLNKYIFVHPECRVLEPSFCYPEGWDIPYKKLIMVRDKSKWINVRRIKMQKRSLIRLINRFLLGKEVRK